MARRPEREQKNEERESEFVDRLVAINRVAKVVKGGKNFGFAALVVVGDEKGRAGFGKGKAREVPEAIRKATEEAKRRMQRIPLREGRTLHHNAAGRWGAGKVVVRSAPPGTVQCGPCLKCWALRTLCPSRSALQTHTTWCAQPLTLWASRFRHAKSPISVT